MLIDLLNLNDREFEDLMDDLYKARDFVTEFHAGAGPGDPRDLVISKQPDGSLPSLRYKYVVQCKRYTPTVNQSHVLDVADTIHRYSANGYILAVTSDVSEPLLEKFRNLTGQGYGCECLRPMNIHDMITESREVFQKYFPEEYGQYVDNPDRISAQMIAEQTRQITGYTLTDTEGQRLKKLLVLRDIVEIPGLQAILNDVSLRELIGGVLNELLGRAPSAYEQVYYAIYLSAIPGDLRVRELRTSIANTREFIARVRFRFTFDDQPRSTIVFDAAGQAAVGFRAYHADYKDGTLTIQNPAQTSYNRTATLCSSNETEFRLVYLEGYNLPAKRDLIVDYKVEGFFQFFVLVRATDGNIYFVQYIDGDGEEQIIEDSGTTYVQFYGNGIENGPLLRKELMFADDLERKLNTQVEAMLALYIGVRGSLEIFQIMID